MQSRKKFYQVVRVVRPKKLESSTETPKPEVITDIIPENSWDTSNVTGNPTEDVNEVSDVDVTKRLTKMEMGEISLKSESPMQYVENKSGDASDASNFDELLCLSTKDITYRQKVAELRDMLLVKMIDKKPNRSKCTMLDLIAYEPEDSTENDSLLEEMDGLKTKYTEFLEKEKTIMEDENKEEDNGEIPAARVKIGANGEVVLDEESLTTKANEELEWKELMAKPVLFEMKTNRKKACLYPKSQRRRVNWTQTENLLFYKALNKIGTDFSTMTALFPNRTRNQLKSKFKSEEKNNFVLVQNAICFPTNYDFDSLKEDFDKQRLLAMEEEKKKLLKKQNSKRRGDQKPCRSRKIIKDEGNEQLEIPKRLQRKRKPLFDIKKLLAEASDDEDFFETKKKPAREYRNDKRKCLNLKKPLPNITDFEGNTTKFEEQRSPTNDLNQSLEEDVSNKETSYERNKEIAFCGNGLIAEPKADSDRKCGEAGGSNLLADMKYIHSAQEHRRITNGQELTIPASIRKPGKKEDGTQEYESDSGIKKYKPHSYGRKMGLYVTQKHGPISDAKEDIIQKVEHKVKLKTYERKAALKKCSIQQHEPSVEIKVPTAQNSENYAEANMRTAQNHEKDAKSNIYIVQNYQKNAKTNIYIAQNCENDTDATIQSVEENEHLDKDSEMKTTPNLHRKMNQELNNETLMKIIMSKEPTIENDASNDVKDEKEENNYILPPNSFIILHDSTEKLIKCYKMVEYLNEDGSKSLGALHLPLVPQSSESND